MTIRNTIKLQINIAADQVVSYEQGLAAILQQEEVMELNLKYLASVNEFLELLDLTRAAFERNILENASIHTGVRHLCVTGTNFPRTRLYIDAKDLVEYLLKYCGLTYWKKVKTGDGYYLLKSLDHNTISNDDIEYLAKALIKGRFKSTKQLQSEFNRSRTIISRLSNIIESVTFAFPGSQRELRRYVFSPNEDRVQMMDYFSRYKSYENQVTKVL